MGHLLREKLATSDDLLAWREALYQQILPSIRQAAFPFKQRLATWATEYQSAMQELLKLITWDLENLARKRQW